MQSKIKAACLSCPIACRFILLLIALPGPLFFVPAPVFAADRVQICYGSASSALLPIARERAFFKEEGLEVELLPYTSGRDSIQAMLDGKCDLSTVAQTPVVHHSFTRKDFLILANLAYSDDFEKIVVRADRGINGPADLPDRRFVLPGFATQHHLLDTYLAAKGINPAAVLRSYMPHKEALKVFRQGEADGIVYREPEVQHLLEEFAGKAKVLPSRSLCVSAYLLVGRLDFVRKNPAAVSRLLKALLKAEDYARKEPAQAKAIAARVYKADQAEIDLIWSLHNYRVSLDQSLFLILENMARWEIGQMPQEKRKPMPNYLDLLALEPLKSLKPEAVSVIH